jgi:hypothetical protein
VTIGAASATGAMWTKRQAESVRSIRGMAVHVLHCDGLGQGRRVGARVLYRRFACLAGARLRHERFDTVAVTYLLIPLGPYRGSASRYRLADVRYAGLQVP